MTYHIETHLHTTHTSKCGWLTADELAPKYKEAGYDAVIVTDHYNRTTFDYLKVDLSAPGDKLTPFLSGYHKMAEVGLKCGLRVFRGAELRFDESDNDYLLFGYTDELLADPESVFRMGIAAFSQLAHSKGALIIQAHPYRKGCTPAIACYLDGVEVYNASPRHDSHNEMAAAYAQQFGLITTSGSDCHRLEDIGRAGIISTTMPSESFGMMRLIRSRNYELIGVEPTK